MHTYVPELSEDVDAKIEEFIESLFKPPSSGA
jgi:hypothetical protein